LYNAYPTLDAIKISHIPKDDTQTYFKIVDNSDIGIIPGSLADMFLLTLGDPK
jgi:hypothetical protein